MIGGLLRHPEWKAMSRRLLKFSDGSVDDYATFSTATVNPSC